jgi:predicted  nucleic acid-binding Zn-ribbon protein
VQVEASDEVARRTALAVLAKVRQGSRPERARIDLIAIALRGKTKDFSKVISLIDDMVALLKREQTDDANKKEYCLTSLDAMDDKKKGLEHAISTAETAMANAEDGIATLKEEIATLEKGIKALDKSVVEATEQRQEEHKEYSELMASDAAAKELINFAKNRMNKFYNPKLYKAPPKRALSAEDSIVTNFGGTLAPTAPPGGIAGTGIALAQVSLHTQRKAAIGPAPEAPAAYAKKTEESTGVIGMMDLLIKDLDKEMTESETSEKEAQKDYEELMKDSAAKRTLDSYSLTEKTSAKASLEGDLQAQTEGKASATKELMATFEYIASLHSECDWLLKYYDVRKEARSGEIDALGKAKDVLSGADYSLLQRGSRGFLRRVQ